jgi:hypothetical protein
VLRLEFCTLAALSELCASLNWSFNVEMVLCAVLRELCASFNWDCADVSSFWREDTVEELLLLFPLFIPL